MCDELPGRWQHIDRLLLRTGPFAQPDFEPSLEVRRAATSHTHTFLLCTPIATSLFSHSFTHLHIHKYTHTTRAHGLHSFSCSQHESLCACAIVHETQCIVERPPFRSLEHAHTHMHTYTHTHTHMHTPTYPNPTHIFIYIVAAILADVAACACRGRRRAWMRAA